MFLPLFAEGIWGNLIKGFSLSFPSRIPFGGVKWRVSVGAEAARDLMAAAVPFPGRIFHLENLQLHRPRTEEEVEQRKTLFQSGRESEIKVTLV